METNFVFSNLSGQTLSYYGSMIFKYWVPFNYRRIIRRRRKKIATPPKSVYFRFRSRKRRKLIQSFQVLNLSDGFDGVVFRTLFAIFDGYKTYRNIEPYFVIRKFLRILCSHRRHFVEYVKYYNSIVDKKFLKGRNFAAHMRVVTRFNFSFFKIHHYFFCCTSYLKLVKKFNRFFFRKNFFLLRFVFRHFFTKYFFKKSKKYFKYNDFIVYKLNRYNLRKVANPLLINNLSVYHYNVHNQTFFSLGFNNISYYFYGNANFGNLKNEDVDEDIFHERHRKALIRNPRRKNVISFAFPLKLIDFSYYHIKYFLYFLLKQRWFYVPSLLSSFNNNFFYFLLKELKFVNFLISFLCFNISFQSGVFLYYYLLFINNNRSYEYFLSSFNYLRNTLAVSDLSVFLRRSLFSIRGILFGEYTVSTFLNILQRIHSFNESISLIEFSSMSFEDHPLMEKYLSLYYNMMDIRRRSSKFFVRFLNGKNGRKKSNKTTRFVNYYGFRRMRRLCYKVYPWRKVSSLLRFFEDGLLPRLLKRILKRRIRRFNYGFSVLKKKRSRRSSYRFLGNFGSFLLTKNILKI